MSDYLNIYNEQDAERVIDAVHVLLRAAWLRHDVGATVHDIGFHGEPELFVCASLYEEPHRERAEKVLSSLSFVLGVPITVEWFAFKYRAELGEKRV